MRDKLRYVRYDVISQKPLQKQAVFDTLRSATQQYMGALSFASSRFKIMSDLSASNAGIIMYVRGYDELIRASFCQVTAIENEQVIVQSVKASGSLTHVKDEKRAG